MDDRFLNELRESPPPRFARELRAKLRELESEEAEPGPRFSFLPALAAAALILFVALTLALPSWRDQALAFLDLFRVRNFTAVEFDPTRLEKLREQHQNNALLVFDGVQTLQEPGPPRAAADPAAAGAAAGIPVGVPSYLPSGFALDSVFVTGEGAARFTADAAKLRALLDALEVRDVTVPPAVDGASVTVRMPAVVMQVYRRDKGELRLVQARTPEVSLPPGLDLAQLAEIGLRILGLSSTDARRIAGSVDWHTTLLVPVPSNATTFTEVTVHGSRGLLITSRPTPDSPTRREGRMLLWATADKVYALRGSVGEVDMTQIAESIP